MDRNTGTSSGLKRGSTSLSLENICGSCGSSFNTATRLKRHQKFECKKTSEELEELSKRASSFHREGAKRRRLDDSHMSQGSGPEVRSPSGSNCNRHSGDAIGSGANGYASAQSLLAERASFYMHLPPAPVESSVSGSSALDAGGKAISGSTDHEPACEDSAVEMSDATTFPPANGEPDSNGPDVVTPEDETFQVDILHPSAPPPYSRTNPGPKDNFYFTGVNSFSLRKRYTIGQPPTHDPDACTHNDHGETATEGGIGDAPGTKDGGKDNAVELLRNGEHAEASGTTKEGERTNASDTVTEAQKADATGTTRNKEEGDTPDPAKEGECTSSGAAKNGQKGASTTESFEPFPNLSSFEIGEWFWGQGTQKSVKDFKALIQILTSPDFSIDDIRKTKWTRIFHELARNKEELRPSRPQWIDDSGWKESDIKVEVPLHSRMAEGKGVEEYLAGKLHHRSIVSIVEEKIRNAQDSQFFHYEGFELMWKPGEGEGSPEYRVLSEMYQSDAFLKAQREVRESTPPEIKDCELPRVVVGLLFWSDASQMSTFSTSKLWPLYMLFANESKYRRNVDDSGLGIHVAYFDSLPDSFKDYLTRRSGGKIPPDLMAHMNREYFHAQWKIILDEDLLKAIVEGIVIICPDGVARRFFIRIFTYSADYPEKVMIATIKTKSDCPCVRCLVVKQNLNKTGTIEDKIFREAHPRVDNMSRYMQVVRARDEIEGGGAVMGAGVTAVLRHSNAPTINAFSRRLSISTHTGFDIFASLVVDLLHEFEIGVFKSFWFHLIRILNASEPGAVLVHRLNRRYRLTPTFNQTIRRFHASVSQLKRRAARDYEDILQCSIPAFDGLLEEPLNSFVITLLYLNARWHALAKLRMQTDATVALLDETTERLDVPGGGA
ncbi:hypothetical protein NMY22_g8609 [Coprinellus aureogranulatus]|nr:hypothetical protein NMY22_g8609 [Coprinellus aureogranulatus]